MKRLNLLQLCLLLCAIAFLSSVVSCVTTPPKKQLTMSYGIYNSQYSQYMTDTGYMVDDDGTWLKVDDPLLTEDQKNVLRKKKEILTQMYPIIKVYDSMVNGVIPHSSSTEQQLLDLIDQLAKLADLGGV